MRRFALIGLLLCSATGTAQADPYRWCAEYGGGRGGGTNCYFVTLEQCRAAVSGNGGFCRESFYDRRPLVSSSESHSKPRRYR
jgi:hypothetical protein